MSRVAHVEARALGPDVDRFRYTARSDEVFTTTTLLQITDEEGATGIGAYDSDTFGDHDRAPLETLRTIVPRLIGLEADDRDHVAALLTEDGTSPFPPAVRSTIDIALWDLTARRAGRTLCEALGGRAGAPSLPAYASVPLLDDEGSYVSSIRDLLSQGFGAVKLHAWGEPARDAELVLAVRGAFPDLTVMHDAEGRYDRAGAEVVARACAEAGVRWFEAPLPDFDLAGFRALRRAVPGVPILAAGDAIWEPRLVADALRDPPWDAMRFDVSFAGGPTAARDLFGVAAEAGLDVELISYGHTVIQAANLHMALAFGRTTYFEQAVPPEPFEHGVRTTIRTGHDGLVHAPDGPGLGIEIDDAAVEQATIALATASA
ncbi:MAG: mandelate racemase/muconate lactonizing enzyme family protein [Actinomycetota bacterium]